MAKELTIQDAFQNVMATRGDVPPKQQQVLAASLALFAEQGFANTTTKEIAARAGVAEGTVYRRYRTKDELLAAVLAPFVSEVFPDLIEDFATNIVKRDYITRHDLIAAVIQDRLHFIQENRDVLQVLLTEVLVRSDVREQLVPQVAPLVAKNLYPVLDRLKAHGELIDWPNDRIAQFMIGTMMSQLVRGILANEEVESAGPMMIAFIEKGLAPA
ncbi:TetR/AcrR family transcriptional regulator [Levilactobacillus enshiensis]|uniref:TetR/AcrR family transcriptional regulator n=1 Tax=Levilactobacillus enshiensis TaxID=2590213 RepID=UPI00131A8FA3|nr:TetR/AcrR family transcriptional regulator [Levilactobacillus enshiensis]